MNSGKEIMVYIMTAKEGIEILYEGLGQGSAHRVQPWVAAVGG